ncbi:MAG TPA: AraC family transcriptional regulator [Candidatus Dorea gallistercoris]|uniref:AraC family transcriptional regulator n=1 Tax=Candidatus Dorea gallistercoris TaxID=2838542 RepID=A0A9D1RBE9_9FIRM|nr:AraC family transcriptional regulator [Candidatus Dorea gallistercoris]
MERYEKKGYLESQFRLFHLTDQETREIEYHYHDFDKITIFIKGHVTYVVEGRSYELKPYDIVLVKHNDLHRLTADDRELYERIIVYISPSFIEAYKTSDYDLSFCFQKAYEEGSNVLRIPSPDKSPLFHAITRLEQSFTDDGYASGLYRQLLFLEFMVHLNRAARRNRLEFLDKEKNGSKVSAILQYINENLSGDLRIDQIAETFYISKYHMMRLFKQETGHTLGNYISKKRLLLAKELILSGLSPDQACFQCGYRDYSTFFRAYRKLFGHSPQEGRTLS